MITSLNVRKDDLGPLFVVWERYLKKHYPSINDERIDQLRPALLTQLAGLTRLDVYQNEQDVYGFIGLRENQIELFFMDPEKRHIDIGSKLIHAVLPDYDSLYVLLDPHDYQAQAFYEQFGFDYAGDRIIETDEGTYFRRKYECIVKDSVNC